MTDKTYQTINRPIDPEIKPRSKWHIVKRIGWAIFMPILLVIVAGLLLVLTGGSGITEKVSDTLSDIWLPMTFIRLAAYIVLAYHVIPFFIRRSAMKNEYRREQLIFQYDNSESENEQNIIGNMIMRIENQLVAYEKYLTHRYWILIALVIFDMLMVQLPYWIR